MSDHRVRIFGTASSIVSYACRSLKPYYPGQTVALLTVGMLLGFTIFFESVSVAAGKVPPGFTDELLFSSADSDLQGLYCLRFAPDGRMFISEWRRGWLRVLTYDHTEDSWTLQPEPYHRFTTPDSNPASETARRGTLRSFDFDPEFEKNGVIYATYMHDEDRRGYRIVAIQQSQDDPNRSDGSERLLFTCPFFADRAQPDAHNGGGVVVGGDGMLYVSFGDGWREESATDLCGFAGKIVRLNRDGSIPSDNVWYHELKGDLRAIIGVGQRNPTCLTRHPVSGQVYINGFTGDDKAGMFKLVQGAHYGHGGSSKLGKRVPEWINTKLANGGTTWACWYPAGGSWPKEYWHDALAVNWMPKSGEIVRIVGGEERPKKVPFADGLVYLGPAGINIGPVAADIGPDGHLYYTVREYGEYTDLRRIRYVGNNKSVVDRADESQPLATAEGSTRATMAVDIGSLDPQVLAGATHGGDAARGRKIFLENDGLACLKCHQYESLGSDVGPPLTDIGSKRSREHLLESILFPNKAIDEVYIQEMLATDEGRVITGRVESETEDHLVLVTAEGKREKVSKAEVEARRRAQSAMPDDFGKRLSLEELRDLVEFFATSGAG